MLALKWKDEVGYCSVSPAALREFGDLYVNQRGAGVTCVRSPFDINPLKTIGIEDDNWIFYEWVMEERFHPLGISGEQDILMINLRGQVFIISEDVGLTAETFDQALDSLITGVSSTQIFNVSNDQNKVRQAAQLRDAIRRLQTEE